MRKLMVAPGLILLAAPAFAQQPNKPNAFYVFVTNPGGGTSTGEHFYSGAVGVGLRHMFTPRISGEVAVSYDEQYTPRPSISRRGITSSTGATGSRMSARGCDSSTAPRFP